MQNIVHMSRNCFDMIIETVSLVPLRLKPFDTNTFSCKMISGRAVGRLSALTIQKPPAVGKSLGTFLKLCKRLPLANAAVSLTREVFLVPNDSMDPRSGRLMGRTCWKRPHIAHLERCDLPCERLHPVCF